ncbi:copper amine oxidase N-terminal domain-containing protein [Paenibacillus chartarius]|uniref:Copper amine oxidase N-terminal domain-containing protein n=1 Tax=Paenibacillus chartarius TaxID=747481 RepID=A0ABV6DFC5_9BACL
MIHKWKRAGLTLMMGAALTVAGGCQSVGGVDLGKALDQYVSQTSIEGKGSWNIELIPGKGTYRTDEEKAIAQLLGGLKLELTRMAVKDPRHASLEGTIRYREQAVPFTFQLDDQKYVLQLDGGQKPIIWDRAQEAENGLSLSMFSTLWPELAKHEHEFSTLLAKFAIKHAPNPSVLTVSQANESVNGETMNLQKVHVEVKGTELAELGKALLKSAVSDEEGMKELLGQLYDLFAPVLKEAYQKSLDEMKSEEEDGYVEIYEEMMSLYMAYLDNKTLTVEFLFTSLQQYAGKVLKELEQPEPAEDEFEDFEDYEYDEYGSEWDRLFTERFSLKADWSLDSSLNVRKSHVELELPLEDDEEQEPVIGLRIVGDTELWNHNRPVEVTAVSTTAGALQVGGEDGAEGVDVLANFKPGSAVYKLLKDDLHITRQTVTLFVNDEYGMYEYDSSHPYVTSDGVSMVPARFIAERFGAEVTWDEANQSVGIKDERSGAVIGLKLGEATAQLNGTEVTLVSAAVNRNGTTYVPLRFIAESFGAKVEWDEEAGLVTMTRE